MIHKRKGRTKRLGVLSDDEVKIINEANKRDVLIEERDTLKLKERKTTSDKKRIKEINRKLKKISTRLSMIVKDLDRRIDVLGPQLILIATSTSLAPFVSVRRGKFFGLPYKEDGAYEKYGIMKTFEDIHKVQYEQYDGTEPIPNFSKWQVKFVGGSPRRYWLDTNVIRDVTIKNIFEPEFAMGKITGVWNRMVDKMVDVKLKPTIEKINVREIIKEALLLEKRFQSLIKDDILQKIIPRTEEDAINIESIKTELVKFKEKLKDVTYKEDLELFKPFFKKMA